MQGGSAQAVPAVPSENEMRDKLEKARSFYLREGVLERIFELCGSREVVPVYWTLEGTKYGARPSTMGYRGDLEFFVKQGAAETIKNTIIMYLFSSIVG